jgi:hypothetical protein
MKNSLNTQSDGARKTLLESPSVVMRGRTTLSSANIYAETVSHYNAVRCRPERGFRKTSNRLP